MRRERSCSLLNICVRCLSSRQLTTLRPLNFKKRKDTGAVEILYTLEGEVLECATSNIFIVKDNVLITPASDILGGITRTIILELAEGNYKIEMRVVREAELRSADEVFITSSFKDVVPIAMIDDFPIANGAVGLVTKDLMARFAKYIS